MVSKQTWLNIADSTTVVWLQTFHLYKGFRRQHTPLGFFVKGSARIVTPPRLEYKGFKFKFNTKGDICRSITIRLRYPNRRLDGSSISFFNNNAVLIKKKQNVKSKYLLGPTEKLLKRRKFKTLFKKIL